MDLIEGSKVIWSARGGEKTPLAAEAPTIAFAFASVVAVREITAGEPLTEENIWVKRPGSGDFTAADYEKLLGKKAAVDIRAGFQLKHTDIQQ
jgi:N-acetylneuraminate synthase